MNPMRRLPLVLLLLAGLVMHAGAGAARACSSCFGDPESNIAKGAVAGVIVLGGVTYLLLMMVAGTGVFWYIRSRRLARAEQGSVGDE